MKLLAKISNEKTKQVDVADLRQKDHFEKIGFFEMEVEQAYDGSYYLKGYTPSQTLDELKSEFSNIDISGARDIVDAISIIYKKTEEEFVFFIDEYDYPIRTCSKSEDLRPYLNFLNGIFKNSDLANAISLAYLTGILPPIADRVESKLNNFKQFSILTPKNMAPYFGFTSSEVKQLCEQYGLSYDECCRWYDGYKLYIDKEYTDVFNPQAVA